MRGECGLSNRKGRCTRIYRYRGAPILAVLWRVGEEGRRDFMNTQTHILVSAALFAQPGATGRNIAAVAGAVVPDVSIYAMYGWAKFTGASEFEIWREIHFSPFWQDFAAATNSIPIYGALFLIGLVTLWPVVSVFALSCLVHIALDFPFHHSDAHRNFWPLSDWRFESPVSYWDPALWGYWVSLGEAVLGIVLVIVLWRRFQAPWIRAILIAALIAYIAVPFHWSAAFA